MEGTYTAGRAGDWRAELQAGAVAVFPVVVAAVPFALLVGALGVQDGLIALEVTLMSALVFAGASQFIAVDMWPAPILSVALTVLVVNLRHILMGAAVAPVMARFGLARAWGPCSY